MPRLWGGAVGLADYDKLDEDRLRSADLLLRSIGDCSAELIYAKDRAGRLLYANPATLAVIGKPAIEVIGKTETEWHDDPEEAAVIHANDERVMASGEVERIEEVFTTHGGLTRYYRSTKAPLRDDDGNIVGVVGTTTDITEQRLAEEHQRILIDELAHRVKNTLATVQSLAFQTFKDVSPRAYRRFEGRLAALSRAHDTLTREDWASAEVTDVVAAALEPFQMGERVSAAGDICRMTPKAAVNFAMILHELATNACKYGALKGRSGMVAVRWTCVPEDGHLRLDLEWRERGGDPVEPPTATGFGTRLITHQVAREFGGTVDFDFAREGLTARFALLFDEPPLPVAVRADPSA
ncbi:sensor histidine kinase [Sphingomonas mesophila]|uniref:sensor histidine kinase n=1 Tax=Sphingomonas mesophila TaxID=2303576 RepID=UPI0013C35B36|nr:HWE histidine kinase domain-containing protein [Sphingomonas mesophila]